MAYLDSPTPTPPRVSPQLLMGAASPLWSYFGAAAVGGVAFWWMTRWTQPVNLEALFDRAIRPVAPPLRLVAPVMEPVAEAAQAVVETVAEPIVEAAPVLEALVEPEPKALVGGEAAPLSPMIAEALDGPAPVVDAPVAFLAPEPELVEPESIIEAAPEQVLEAAAEAASELIEEAIPEPVMEDPLEDALDGAVQAMPEPEPAAMEPAVMEATAEPVLAAAPKPKAKKAAPPATPDIET